MRVCAQGSFLKRGSEIIKNVKRLALSIFLFTFAPTRLSNMFVYII